MVDSVLKATVEAVLKRVEAVLKRVEACWSVLKQLIATATSVDVSVDSETKRWRLPWAKLISAPRQTCEKL